MKFGGLIINLILLVLFFGLLSIDEIIPTKQSCSTRYESVLNDIDDEITELKSDLDLSKMDDYRRLNNIRKSLEVMVIHERKKCLN